MKTLYKYLWLLMLPCLLWSCSKEIELREPPISTPHPVQVTAIPDYYGKVRFTFPDVDRELVKYGIIHYRMGEEAKELKFSDFDTEVVLEGLQHETSYSFRIIFYGQTDRPSKVFATPEIRTKGSVALMALNSMAVVSTAGGLKFSFSNTSGRALKYTFKYTNNNVSKEEVHTSATPAGEFELKDLIQAPTSVMVTVNDLSEGIQETKTFTETPKGITVGQIIQSLTATYSNKEVTLSWANTTGKSANIVFSSANVANSLTLNTNASESVTMAVVAGETVSVLATVKDLVSGETSTKALSFRNSVLARTGWSILDFDSQQSLATDVLDNLPSYWHTQWGTTKMPRFISLNMAAQRTFDGLWIKSSSATPGPAKVEVFVKKTAGDQWQSLGYYPVPRATQKNNDQYIILPLTTAQYFRVQMNELNVNNETHCSFSELGVFKIQ